MLLLSSVDFSKINFCKIFFLGVSTGLDPDQDRHSVGPDLCTNCLQRSSAVDKITANRQRVNGHKTIDGL